MIVPPMNRVQIQLQFFLFDEAFYLMKHIFEAIANFIPSFPDMFRLAPSSPD